MYANLITVLAQLVLLECVQRRYKQQEVPLRLQVILEVRLCTFTIHLVQYAVWYAHLILILS